MRIRDVLTCLFGVGSAMTAGVACADVGLPPGALALNDRQAAYTLEVLVDGQPAPTFQFGGETYVLGQLGERYTLRVRNNSPRRIEAVVSVDGRDAIDGKAADYRGKRGYLVPAWGQVDIDGWRLSRWQAAAFRFSSVEQSYAARSGAPRDVGVIGAAIFSERYVPPPPPPRVYEVPAPRAQQDEDYDYRRDRGASGMHSMDDMASAPRKGKSAPAPEASAAPASPSASAEAAPSSRAGGAMPWQPPSDRPVRGGLGTEFGEAVTSTIHEVAFVRANPNRPSVIMGVRYNDHAGLMALGIDVDRLMCRSRGCDPEIAIRRTASPFPVSDRRFAPPPAGWSPDGR